MSEWMKELQKEDNNKEFSKLVHEYYKLASMRVMQTMREKYKIPKEEIPNLTLAIFARMLNEGVYSVGSCIKNDYTIENFYSKEQLLNLVRVLNGECLNQENRSDIDVDIKSSLDKFRKFIMENGGDFYL